MTCATARYAGQGSPTIAQAILANREQIKGDAELALSHLCREWEVRTIADLANAGKITGAAIRKAFSPVEAQKAIDAAKVLLWSYGLRVRHLV